MSPGYIPFDPNPSKPKFKPPPGAVDAYCHVFGPEQRGDKRALATMCVGVGQGVSLALDKV